jgi:hypothetical protein
VSSPGFQPAELPEPPRPHGLGWLSAVGPGVIALGVSLGSGEFLLGPAGFVQHGFSLLWVVLIAIAFQTIFYTRVPENRSVLRPRKHLAIAAACAV